MKETVLDLAKCEPFLRTTTKQQRRFFRHSCPLIPSLSPSLSTVHKICLGVISPPTQENNERQWHDRLDIDEIAAVTICTTRLGPSFASEMGKGYGGGCVGGGRGAGNVGC